MDLDRLLQALDLPRALAVEGEAAPARLTVAAEAKTVDGPASAMIRAAACTAIRQQASPAHSGRRIATSLSARRRRCLGSSGIAQATI
jgi:hypothetical protein